MRTGSRLGNERGIALIMTLFLAIVIAGIAIGVIMMTSNATLISRFHAKEAMMEAAADAGLEQGRDSLNGGGVVLGVTGFDTLELAASVRDASGNIIPGFTRSVFAGRSGITTGQFGVFASVISVISDPRGAVVVRRAQLSQESFAKYAEFTDTFPGGLCVGYGNVKFGPVHSNQNYNLCSTGPAIFNGKLTAVGVITNQAVGTYNAGFQTGVPRINMPTPVQLSQVQTIAAAANMVIAGGSATAGTRDPSVRIEFVAIDLNGNGNTTDANEGFIRVFRAAATGTVANNRAYVNARPWGGLAGVVYMGGASNATDPNMFSPNCGGFITRPAGAVWLRADSIITIFGNSAAGRDSVRLAYGRAGHRCYLGGDSVLTRNPLTDAWDPSVATPYGAWVPWALAPNAAVIAAVGATKAAYLWPITRALNNNFQGVIYVNGSIGVSGQVRSQALLAATGDVMLDDDLTYVTAPNTTCADILGYTSPQGIHMADNNVNSPFRVNNNYQAHWDDTDSETYNGVFLALTTFDGENPTTGAQSSTPAAGREDCPVGIAQGRGCDVVVGGLIQRNAGATASTSGAGWNDQYSYDNCSLNNPPPYFPTTGRYSKYQYYEIDPVGFSVATWYANNQ
ncbi:MAG: hypothetical protein ABJD11_08455 [Gemmatimonadota bacterium]